MALKPVQLAQVNGAVNAANFNLNIVDNEIVWHTGGCSVATIQMNSAVASATVTIQRSNDGRKWFALETAQMLGPLDDLSDAIDLAGFLYLRVVCGTTASGTAEFIALGKESS